MHDFGQIKHKKGAEIVHFGSSNLILILAKIMISARIKKNPGWNSEPGPGPGAFQIKSAGPDPDPGPGRVRASGLPGC